MNKILNLTVLLALLGATATPVFAYIPPGDHYLCDYPQDIKFYRYFRWTPEEFPIRVYIPQPQFKTDHPEMYVPLVQQAFLSWSSYLPAISFTWVASPEEAQIKVTWQEKFPDSESTWGQAMYPNPYFDTQRKLKHKSEIQLALRAQEGTTLIAGQNPFFVKDELLAIATHEVGHSLGLPHSKNRDDLMSAYIFRFSAESRWGITQRDIDTLKRLYSLPADLKISPCNG